MSDRIALGIIRKPHGVRGEASVEVWSDDPERLGELSNVTLVSPDEKATRGATIESTRFHSGRALVKFKEIASPEELRGFQNWTIEIPESEARALEEDEYFLHDLAGLSLVDESGHDRGTVVEAYEGGGGILLTVRNGKREFDVPFAAEICRKVDLAGKKIVVSLPEGLDDLESLPAVDDKSSTDERDPAPSNAADGRTKLRIDFVTIFPKMFEPLIAEGVIARGIKQGLLDVRVWDLRDYTTDKHRSTDDEAYGGGPGMVMLAEPILRCVDAVLASGGGRKPHVVATTPQGRMFTQQVAREFASAEWIVILCGRYEGFDHRIHLALNPDEVSIGDYVVSGGELPAMIMADAAGRMIEGVVGNSGSVEEDSFFRGLLDYPHYTRPEDLRGMKVPDILMSGHHEKIRRWRREQALRATLERRPDLLETAELDDEALQILAEIAPESEWAKRAPVKAKRKKR